MVKINHFSHEHQLKSYSPKLFQNDDDDEPMFHLPCGVCGQEIDLSKCAYGCGKCNYFIDKSCSELQQERRHIFHPQHDLCLFNISDNPSSNCRCSACRFSLQKFGYRCSVCEFYLDLVCASLSPTRENTSSRHLIDQPHPLFACDKPAGYDRKCCCCNLHFSETDSKICICIECSHVLHESCASRKEIAHPFHKHPLTLLPPPEEKNININCALCPVQHNNEGPYMFQCGKCGFTLDFWCAALKPTSKREVQKRDLNHKHPLIECDYIKEFQHSCGGCDRHIEDSIFVCLDCGMLLDKLCADLPLRVEHLCHPQHSFELNQREKHDYQCWLCRAKHFSVFDYSCSCNFHLDPFCANTKPSIIHCKFHEHPLAYFSESNKDGCLICDKCRECCLKNFLHCVVCSYTIHLRCYPNLPRKIKQCCHCDPLVLTYSKIKDDPHEEEDDDDEFYCNACEKLRNVRHPTYYCRECHFVAHLHCVVPEILNYMETESSQHSLGSVKLNTSLNYVRDDVTMETAASTVDDLEKSENFDGEDEAEEESCSLVRGSRRFSYE